MEGKANDAAVGNVGVNKDFLLSKSRVMTYLGCPYKYKLKYVDGIPEPPSQAMTRGSDIHNALAFFNELWSGDYEKDLRDTLVKFPAWQVQLRSYIEFLKSLAKEVGQVYIKPDFVEEDITFDKFRGIIDAVFLVSPGLLIDYKSGKKHSLGKYRVELGMYAWLFEKRYHYMVKKWGIYFVDQNEALIETATKKEVMNSLNLFNKIYIDICNNVFPRMPELPCNWCPYFKKECAGPK